jgi:hypothetical protein
MIVNFTPQADFVRVNAPEAGGWRVTGIVVQAESATAPLPKEYLP